LLAPWKGDFNDASVLLVSLVFVVIVRAFQIECDALRLERGISILKVAEIVSKESQYL